MSDKKNVKIDLEKGAFEILSRLQQEREIDNPILRKTFEDRAVQNFEQLENLLKFKFRTDSEEEEKTTKAPIDNDS